MIIQTTKRISQLLSPRLVVLSNKWLRYSFVVIFSLLFLNSNAQTVFWTETFDGASCPTSACDPSLVSWTVVSTGAEGASANKFYVSCRENGNAATACGTDCVTADQSLHIGNVPTSAAAFLFCPNGDCGASYDASGGTEVSDKRCESPIIDCSGKSTITLNFNYIEKGQNTLDDATLWYFDGTTWAQINALAKSVNTGCLGQGKWTARLVSLPVSADNNPLVKIAFRWVNNGDGTGSDPSFAVDDITASYLTILPIELISFTGYAESKVNKLHWTTASELNNDFFTLERSFEGVKFKEVSTLLGAGNSSQTLNYSLIDSHPFSDVTYYRLKQTDYNGEYKYSNVISIDSQTSDFDVSNVYHSLDENGIVVTYSNNDNATIHFELIDMQGKKIISTSQNGEGNQLKSVISVGEISSGIYLLKASNGTKIISKKFIF